MGRGALLINAAACEDDVFIGVRDNNGKCKFCKNFLFRRIRYAVSYSLLEIIGNYRIVSGERCDIFA